VPNRFGNVKPDRSGVGGNLLVRVEETRRKPTIIEVAAAAEATPQIRASSGG